MFFSFNPLQLKVNKEILVDEIHRNTKKFRKVPIQTQTISLPSLLSFALWATVGPSKFISPSEWFTNRVCLTN